jgi:hypothetical protein
MAAARPRRRFPVSDAAGKRFLRPFLPPSPPPNPKSARSHSLSLCAVAGFAASMRDNLLNAAHNGDLRLLKSTYA